MKLFSFLNLVTPLFLIMLTACSSPQPAAESSGQSQTGKASYYADKYQGRQTASGEVFDQNAKTAAHRSLPFGTMVKVTNTKNGKSVVVRINDRGPFVKGRIIDLSRSAFTAVGNPASGTVDVTVVVLQ